MTSATLPSLSRLHLRTIVPCLIAGATLLIGLPADQHIEMVPVAVFPFQFVGSYPCGDANHDGNFEAFSTVSWTNDSMVIIENRSGNDYRVIRPGTIINRVLAAGDLDGDSLFDLVAPPGNWCLQVFESRRPDTFPTDLVFVDSTPGGEILLAAITDLDRDGHREILTISGNGDGMFLYECRGDNQYAEVSLAPYHGAYGMFAVGDFDGDSLEEAVAGDGYGNVFVYECTGNDSYALSCSLNYHPDNQSCNFAAANDMDLDGHPECIGLFVNEGWDSCIVRVFEESRHGQFDCVWRFACPGLSTPDLWVTTGDVDGDGVQEFAVSTGCDIRFFRCIGPDQYEQVGQLNRGGIRPMRFFDINRDGRDELIFSYPEDSTYIFEDTNGLVALQFERLPKPQVRALPSTIVRTGAPVIFPGLIKGTSVSLYDIRGRVVAKHTLVRDGEWRWNLTDQDGRPVPQGTYFVAIRSLNRTTQTKLCVIN